MNLPQASALRRHQSVSDVMTSHVHVAGPLAPFKFLIRLIEENRISSIPIVDQHGVPVGIVSEADLQLMLERPREPESPGDVLQFQKRRHTRAKAGGSVASEVMTSPALTIPADSSLSQAARLMQEKKVGRLVVVDRGGRIAGIVSQSDLLQAVRPKDRGPSALDRRGRQEQAADRRQSPAQSILG